MAEPEDTEFNDAILDDSKSCDDPMVEVADNGKLEFEDKGIGLIEDPAIEEVGLLTPPPPLPSPPQAAKLKQTVIKIIFFTQVCMALTSALNTGKNYWITLRKLDNQNQPVAHRNKNASPRLAFLIDYFMFIAALRLVWRQPHKPGVHSN
jgi:hypothetical protein